MDPCTLQLAWSLDLWLCALPVPLAVAWSAAVHYMPIWFSPRLPTSNFPIRGCSRASRYSDARPLSVCVFRGFFRDTRTDRDERQTETRERGPITDVAADCSLPVRRLSTITETSFGRVGLLFGLEPVEVAWLESAHTKSPSRGVVAAAPLPKRPGVGSTNDAESSVRLRPELLAPPQCQVSESMSTASPALSANQHEGGRCATRASVGGSQRSSGRRQTDYW